MKLKQFDFDSQLEFVMEECTELILAIQRYKRTRGTIKEISDEIIDVQFTTSALATLIKKDEV